jgi:glutamate 5-kinase
MKYKRIVVKIGSSVLAQGDGNIDRMSIEGVASQVADLLDEGREVILVSSGAIASGVGVLGIKRVPARLSDLQAIASIGQNQLMNLYNEAFKKRGYLVGQILLTQDDFDDRRRYLNIKYTVDALLSRKVVPIVNENDTVSTEEIKCGDNDRLSGLVADLSGADALIILSNVDGLYDRTKKVIPCIEEISADIERLIEKKECVFTKGGMATKIEAAQMAVASGIHVIIANGKRDRILHDVLAGKGTHTYFKPRSEKAKAKKRWIAYSSKAKGRIIVDGGAKKALIAGNKSLLATGIVAREGNFKAGDVVGICGPHRKEFARGLTNYSSKELDRIQGLKTTEIAQALGYKDHDEIVHRDNLVIL